MVRISKDNTRKRLIKILFVSEENEIIFMSTLSMLKGIPILPMILESTEVPHQMNV